MVWANEPVVFTSLTIHFHLVNIVKVKGNTEHRSNRALPTHYGKEPICNAPHSDTARVVKFIVLLLHKAKAKCLK